jgi:Zn-dependent membrane protease YugP
VVTAFSTDRLTLEFAASRRAKTILGKMGFIQAGAGRAAVSQVLKAAGWTYGAAFVSSLVNFRWHLLPLLTGRDRR